MSERIDKLRAALHELDAELAALSAPELRPETRAQLEQTLAELQSALASPSHALEPQSWAERLTESAEAFRDSHPTLFVIVGRATDALARIGI